jgi:hypothetical protein
MTALLVGYLLIGFGVSIYLLFSMGPAKPGDTRWDRIVFYPELWVFAVTLWPLYLTIRILRSRRRQYEETELSSGGEIVGEAGKGQCHIAEEKQR